MKQHRFIINALIVIPKWTTQEVAIELGMGGALVVGTHDTNIVFTGVLVYQIPIHLWNFGAGALLIA